MGLQTFTKPGNRAERLWDQYHNIRTPITVISPIQLLSVPMQALTESSPR